MVNEIFKVVEGWLMESVWLSLFMALTVSFYVFILGLAPLHRIHYVGPDLEVYGLPSYSLCKIGCSLLNLLLSKWLKCQQATLKNYSSGNATSVYYCFD